MKNPFFRGEGVVPQCELCIDCKLETNITLTQMAKFLFHSLFHAGIQVSDEKWTIMDQGVSNKCGSFGNDIQLQLGVTII